MKMSVRVPTGPFDFGTDELYPMAVMGRFFTALAAYEHDCDELIFSIVEHHPTFLEKHKFKPTLNSDDKRRTFIITALTELECLTILYENEGQIPASEISKTMEMIWHHRINLTHGRIVSKRIGPLGVDYSLRRWSRVNGEKLEFKRSTYNYDTELMESILERVSDLRAMLHEAKLLVCGTAA